MVGPGEARLDYLEERRLKPLPTNGAVPRELLEPLRGKRVLITGPTGFVGRWMLETLGNADVGALIGTCGSSTDDMSQPNFNPWTFVEPFDYVIHCTLDGCRLNEAMKLVKPGGRMLLLSSGAVEVIPLSDYARMKIEDEQTARDVAVIARMFSFVGPGLRRHIGREFLEVSPITVKNDGAQRSWMYAADMARALWTVLLRGEIGEVYNVGSPEPYLVADLAYKCALARNVDYCIDYSEDAGTFYVPNTKKLESLGYNGYKHVDAAIHSTLNWVREC
jgi:nucleoside-diphosphate-sugar epimerase